MTTVSTARISTSRVAAAARVQLLLQPRIQLTSWLVLTLSFAVNLAIFSMVSPHPSREATTGGFLPIYIFPLIFTMQAVVQVFPLASGLGLSRRAFTLAATVLATIQAVVYGTILFVLTLIERATGGWGVHMRFFDYPGFLTGNRAVQLVMFIVAFGVVEFLGFALGAIYQRWGLSGEIVILTSVGVIVALAVLLVTWQHRWGGVLGWFGDRSVLTAAVGLPLLLTLVLLGGGWRVLRRATP